MNGVDTNILVYRVDDTEPAKRSKARTLLRSLYAQRRSTVLLWQVLAEFLAQMRNWQMKGRIEATLVARYFKSARRLFAVALPKPKVFDQAFDLSARYSLSHWDSMILGACKEAGIDVFYTEDMGAPRVIDG